MDPREYFAECARLSDEFGSKVDAVNQFVAANPDLLDEGVYDRFCDLQDEAAAASGAWAAYCQNNRSKVVWR